jgi:hypothetical protein
MAEGEESEIWRRAEASPFVAGGLRLLEGEPVLLRRMWTLRSDVDVTGYDNAGTIRVFVRDRLFTNPGRRIRRNGNDQGNSGEKVAQPNQIHPHRRTRWDIDAAQIAGAGKKRVRIKVVLAEGLEFFPVAWEIPAITAKSEAAANRLVNLETGLTDNGRHFAQFWALSAAGGQPHADEYNIAIVAKDDDDTNFALPIIIDPPIRNRG